MTALCGVTRVLEYRLEPRDAGVLDVTASSAPPEQGILRGLMTDAPSFGEYFEKDGLAHGIDVWEAVEAFEHFVPSTLMPAMAKVATARASTRQRWANPK